MDAIGVQGMSERTADMLLSDQVGKAPRPPLASQRYISHSLPFVHLEVIRTSLDSGTRHRRCRCSLPGLTGFTTGRRGVADADHHGPDAGGGRDWRRGWDSNPRTPVKMLLEFQSSAFDRSATSPINNL